MVVNRYSNISTPRYTPRTLEEMMVAPAYMRGEHDKLDASRSMLRAQVAQADSLDVHDARLMEAQKGLYDQMDANASKLLNEGFSPSAKSDFYKFNGEYQQSVGPKGDIGRMQAAKAAFTQEKAALMKNGVAMGLSPASIERNIAEAYEKYGQEFAEDGIIKNMEMPMPPSFQDMQQDLNSLKQNLGSTASQAMNKGELEIVENKHGLLVYKQLKGANLHKDNFSQLQDGLDKLNAKWFNGGPGDQFSQWEGQSEEYRRDFLTGGINSMRESSNLDGRYYDQQIVEGGEAPDPEAYFPLQINCAHAFNALNKNISIEDLDEIVAEDVEGPLTEEQQTANLYVKMVEDRLVSSNSFYVETTERLARAQKNLEGLEERTRKHDSLFAEAQEKDKKAAENPAGNPMDPGTTLATNYAGDYLDKVMGAARDAVDHNQSIANRLREKELRSLKYNTSMYNLYANSSDAVKSKGYFDQAIFGSLQDSFAANNNFVNYNNVVTANGNALKRDDLSVKDTEAINAAIFNTEGKTPSVAYYSVAGRDGNPAMGIKIPGSAIKNGKYEGEGVVLEFSITDFENDKGTGTMGNILLTYLRESVGTPESIELANTMERQFEVNQHKGETWGDTDDMNTNSKMSMIKAQILNQSIMDYAYIHGKSPAELTVAEKVRIMRDLNSTPVTLEGELNQRVKYE